MTVRSLCVLAVSALCAALPAQADPVRQVEQGWLQTLAFAAHQTEYSGTFVYQHGNHVETSRIVHLVDGGGEYEHLESLDGPHREIIRSNGQTWCVLGEQRSVRVEKGNGRRTFPDLLPDQITALNQNYQIREAERARVAGFETQAIVFQPRDGLRYAHKMWAHLDSGLLLKSVMLDEKGTPVEQYAFTQLTVGGNIDRSWLATLPKKLEKAASQPAAIKLEASPWRVDVIPAGFKVVAEMRRPLRDRKQPVIHLVYSDGLAGISVFIEPERRPGETVGLTSHGAVHVFTRTLDGFRVTVVGEVPARTVVQVADSVRYAGQ
jgi:sigma-E factor negative regulatory protein RseB